MYEVQLNAYAAIGERCGFVPVIGLALIYREPMTNGRGGLERQCPDCGFDMGFSAHVLPVDLNPMLLHPLLAQTRELFESLRPPAGRPGCKNCSLLDKLNALAASSHGERDIAVRTVVGVAERNAGLKCKLL